MRKIYLATQGGKAEKAFFTKKEALLECLKMAQFYHKKLTEPMENVSGLYDIKEINDTMTGYSVLFSYFYIVSVDLKEKSE